MSESQIMLSIKARYSKYRQYNSIYIKFNNKQIYDNRLVFTFAGAEVY